MPYNPSQNYQGGAYLYGGLSSMGEGISKGIFEAVKKRDEQAKEIFLLDSITNEAIKSGEPIDMNAYMAGSLTKKREIAAKAAASIHYRENQWKQAENAAQIAHLGAETAKLQAEAKGGGRLGTQYWNGLHPTTGKPIPGIAPGFYTPDEISRLAVASDKANEPPDIHTQLLAEADKNTILNKQYGITAAQATDRTRQHGYVQDKSGYRNLTTQEVASGAQPTGIYYGDFIPNDNLPDAVTKEQGKGGVARLTPQEQDHAFKIASIPIQGIPGTQVTDVNTVKAMPTDANRVKMINWLQKNPKSAIAPGVRKALGLSEPVAVPKVAPVANPVGPIAPTPLPSGTPAGPMANPTPVPTATPTAAPITPPVASYQGSGQNVDPRTAAILEWVRQNPNDPQAQAILAQLQGQ